MAGVSMKVGRNDPCPCGSGKKYKACCLEQRQQEQSGIPTAHKLAFGAVGLLLLAAVVAMAVNIVGREAQPVAGKRVWSEEHQHWHEEP